MTKMALKVVVAMTLVFTSQAFGNPQSGDDYIEKGLYAEESLGDLNQALEFY